jgi:chromosomal replication initiation ATPase DnaA
LNCVIAALCGEEKHDKSTNEDIHKSTAQKFNVPLEEVTREQRSVKTKIWDCLWCISI